LVKNNHNKCFVQVLNPTNDVINLNSGLILSSINEIYSTNIASLDDNKSKKQSDINISSITLSSQKTTNQTDLTFD
jgi:hypothetical protein